MKWAGLFLLLGVLAEAMVLYSSNHLHFVQNEWRAENLDFPCYDQPCKVIAEVVDKRSGDVCATVWAEADGTYDIGVHHYPPFYFYQTALWLERSSEADARAIAWEQCRKNPEWR
jgi:hypothetical protein